MTPLVLLTEAPEGDALGELLEHGFTAVAARGPEAPAAARQAAAAGLAVAALVGGAELDPVAAEVAAWARVPEDDLLQVSGPEAGDTVAARGALPELVAWVTPDGEDPGSALDEDLAELVDRLRELGFEGGLALRAASPTRLAKLLAVVQEVLAEQASWWDGSEDGY